MVKKFSKFGEYWCFVLAAIFIVMVTLGACNGDPSGGASSAFPSTKLVMKSFTGEYLGLDNPEDIVNALYKESVSQPHFLAQVVSRYPSLLKECGVGNLDAIDLNHRLCLSDDGAELQENLLKALKEMLESPGLNIRLEDGYHGYAMMLYAVTDRDLATNDGHITPADIGLVWVPIYQDQPCVFVINEAGEIGCFDLRCDLQTFVPAD